MIHTIRKTQQQQRKEMSELNKLVENFQYRSLLSYDHIKANTYDRTSHVERISDYLTEHEGFCWKKIEIGN